MPVDVVCAHCGTTFRSPPSEVKRRRTCSKSCSAAYLTRSERLSSSEIVEIIAANIIPVPFSGCLLWLGAMAGNGYGTLYIGGGNKNGKVVLVHKYWYEHHRGAVPSGLELDHLCRVPLCINPDHLEPVSHIINLRRGRLGFDKQPLLGRPRTCQSGLHTVDDGNVVYDAAGSRRCLTCRRAYMSAWRARRALQCN